MSWKTLPCRIIPGMTRGEYVALREELAAENCDTCPYCNRPIYAGGQWGKATATVDHIEPRIAGGSDERENLVIACYSCNSAKGEMSLLIFMLLRPRH
jgi:5-methylcytosine-specific restriction endonuclease McrA